MKILDCIFRRFIKLKTWPMTWFLVSYIYSPRLQYYGQHFVTVVTALRETLLNKHRDRVSMLFLMKLQGGIYRINRRSF